MTFYGCDADDPFVRAVILGDAELASAIYRRERRCR